ncbi:MAG: MBL fold metallo-hydrolase [Candidatus Bipolaricaulota bacterium]|nr:MBL fold metallo-hydrolase [Candidatus Bipolaricaulota bacterium]
MRVLPVWFDSLGAKSMCVLVRTPDLSLLIDPGAAVMQPSYPAPDELKVYYLELAREAIVNAAAEASHVVITHYHYDHFSPERLELFAGKTLWIKDPNQWINRSQWNRGRAFLAGLARQAGLRFCERPPGREEYPDPVERLTLAARGPRRQDLIDKWRKRFLRLVSLWRTGNWVDEERLGARITFADGRRFRIGNTIVRFSTPMFHGVEYASTGWVLGVIVEHGGKKFLYSSDLQGPALEDYAAWIISEGPDVLVLDGPATYLLGPFQSKANLARAIRNCVKTVHDTNAGLTILDHHLTREANFRNKTQQAFSAGAMTAAAVLGRGPLVERLIHWRDEGKLEKVLEAARKKTLDRDLLERHEYQA